MGFSKEQESEYQVAETCI